MKEKWTDEMKRKLEGHGMAPPEGLWEGISEEMGIVPETASRSGAVRRWSWAAAATVLALVGFFTLYQHNSQEAPLLAENTVPSSVQKEASVPSQTLDEPVAQELSPRLTSPAIQQTSPDTSPSMVSLPANETQKTPKEKEWGGVDTRDASAVLSTESLGKSTAENALNGKGMTDKEQEEKPALADNDALSQTTEPKGGGDMADKRVSSTEQRHGELLTTISENPSPIFISAATHSAKPSWSVGLKASGGLLAANNSGNGLVYTPGSKNGMTYNDPDFGSFPASTYSPDSEGVKYEAKHHLPIRLGASLHYQLNDRLALLSGINYTYLYSEFIMKVENQLDVDIDQKLHYLGIPLGVTYQLWSNKQLQVYLSGSVMLEKCLNEKPWQWSVDAAAGAEYAITKQLGLYLEPSLGYYFDDGTSFEHYYKEHPLAPAIEFGLRLHVHE